MVQTRCSHQQICWNLRGIAKLMANNATNHPYTGPAPRSPEQVDAIIKTLKELYPQAKYELNFSTPLELLVATILAAQCTDERVNAVTKDLFQKYHSANDYASVEQEELEKDVHPTGFYRKKIGRASCRERV